MSNRPPTIRWWEALLFLAALTAIFMLTVVLPPLEGAPS